MAAGASSQPVSLSGPTLELCHKDNQTIFSLSAMANENTRRDSSANENTQNNLSANGNTDLQEPRKSLAEDTEFQSIENRRSKLLETFTARAPPGGDASRPVMEVKPRANSTTSPTELGRHFPAGAKPVLPKPSLKPKPSKKSHQGKTQRLCLLEPFLSSETMSPLCVGAL